MKRALILVVLALVASAAFAQFRDTEWGMSLEDVIAIEGRGEISHDGDAASMTFFDVRLLDFTGSASFQFRYGELYAGLYMMPAESFDRIDAALRRRFGEPDAVEFMATIWQDGDTEIGLARSPAGVFVTYMDVERLMRFNEKRTESDAAAF